MVCSGVELPAEANAFMALVGRHFRPLIEPVPVFGDDELRRLTLPIQLWTGARDLLVDAASSARRLQQLLPHADVHLLAERGHVIVDQGEAILRFLERSIDAPSQPG